MAKILMLVSIGLLPQAAVAVEPLSQADAVAAKARLVKMQSFLGTYRKGMFEEWQGGCRANARAFQGNCSNMTKDMCKKYRCGNESLTDQTSCEQAGESWWHDGDKENDQCCSWGNLECQMDASGEELEWGCCEPCLNASSPYYNSMCVEGKSEGVSICGTTAGTCSYCTIPGRDSEGSCTSSSMCSNNPDFDYDLTNCEQGNGTYIQGVWMQNKTATSEEMCKSLNHCGYCAGSESMQNDQRSCENAGACSGASGGRQAHCEKAGGNWTSATWTVLPAVTDEDTCKASSKGGISHSWVKVQNYESGDELPDPELMTRQECSTGPKHEEPSHILSSSSCFSAEPFLEDAAAGLTVAQAKAKSELPVIEGKSDANYTREMYYKYLRSAMVDNAIVTNHPNATERAEILFNENTCFMILAAAKNKGKVTVRGSNKTYAVIMDPTNYADADPLTFTGGNVTIMGGTNAGGISVDTPGKIEVLGTVNSGPISVKTSKNILLAGVLNKAGAEIVVDNVSATLIDVTNEGSVTVTGDGSYKAYGIVNKGTVTIEGGNVELHLVCPSDGTVTVSAGVTGKVTYETGCKGTLNLPSGVTEEEASSGNVGEGGSSGPKEFKVTKFETAVSLDNASAFDADKFKEALIAAMGVAAEKVEVESISFEVKVSYSFDGAVTEAEAKTAIATTAGVDESKVTIVVGGTRRLNARRLATTVDATIEAAEATDLAAIASAASNTSSLTTALSNAGVTVTPTITAQPTKAVKVKTAVKSDADAAVAPTAPTAGALKTQLEDKLGVTVTADVQNVETVTVVETTTTTRALADGSASFASRFAQLPVALGLATVLLVVLQA